MTRDKLARLLSVMSSNKIKFNRQFEEILEHGFSDEAKETFFEEVIVELSDLLERGVNGEFTKSMRETIKTLTDLAVNAGEEGRRAVSLEKLRQEKRNCMASAKMPKEVHMELNDVLIALEELKKGLSDVKTANENVERAASAAHKVCEAFSRCVGKLDKFTEEVIDPIRSKVDDIAEASSQMVQKSGEVVEELRKEANAISESFNAKVVDGCKRISNEVNVFHTEIESMEKKLDDIAISVERKIATASSQMVQRCSESVDELNKQASAIRESFNATVADSCKRLQDDVNEFHKELESFELKLARVAGRVEEKADAVIDETRKVNGVVEKGISDIVTGQTELGEKITKRGDEVINELKVIKGIGATTKKILVVAMTFSVLSFAATSYLILKGFGIVP